MLEVGAVQTVEMVQFSTGTKEVALLGIYVPGSKCRDRVITCMYSNEKVIANRWTYLIIKTIISYFLS